jgi:hypothetical protein
MLLAYFPPHRQPERTILMKRFLSLVAAAFAVAFLADPTLAADLAVKAPASIFKSYPYGSSGFFVGLFTEGGAGQVTGSVPGVNSASLTSTQAGAGLTVGYAWGQAGSPVAFSVEGDFGWTNFNGSSPGFSLSGPAAFEQRFMMFTPLTSLSSLNLLPGLGTALGTVPPFPALGAGVSASNLQVGLMAGIDENDISANFVGLPANREWRIAPMVGLVAMEQLSNGTAVRSWAKTVFPERGVCAGPLANACVNEGQQFKVGVGVYY